MCDVRQRIESAERRWPLFLIYFEVGKEDWGEVSYHLSATIGCLRIEP